MKSMKSEEGYAVKKTHTNKKYDDKSKKSVTSEKMTAKPKPIKEKKVTQNTISSVMSVSLYARRK